MDHSAFQSLLYSAGTVVGIVLMAAVVIRIILRKISTYKTYQRHPSAVFDIREEE